MLRKVRIQFHDCGNWGGGTPPGRETQDRCQEYLMVNQARKSDTTCGDTQTILDPLVASGLLADLVGHSLHLNVRAQVSKQVPLNPSFAVTLTSHGGSRTICLYFSPKLQPDWHTLTIYSPHLENGRPL